MENKLTPEIIEKAKAAKSAEEILALAKENDVEMSADGAATLYRQINQSGELSDDELDDVAGGNGCGPAEDIARAIFQPGTRVRVATGEHTGKCGTVESYSLDPRSYYHYVGVLNISLDDGTPLQRTHECFNAKFDFKVSDFGVEKI